MRKLTITFHCKGYVQALRDCCYIMSSVACLSIRLTLYRASDHIWILKLFYNMAPPRQPNNGKELEKCSELITDDQAMTSDMRKRHPSHSERLRSEGTSVMVELLKEKVTTLEFFPFASLYIFIEWL